MLFMKPAELDLHCFQKGVYNVIYHMTSRLGVI